MGTVAQQAEAGGRIRWERFGRSGASVFLGYVARKVVLAGQRAESGRDQAGLRVTQRRRLKAMAAKVT